MIMKRWILPLLVVFFVLASMWPTLYEIGKRNELPANRTFELIHNYYTDYNFYLSRIREGWDGRWTVVERYTTEPHNGSFIQIFYLLLGQMARVVKYASFAVPGMYHVSRFLLGIVLLALTASFAKSHFKSFSLGVLAFVTAVTASSWPVIVHNSDPLGFRFGGYMPWWTVMDSLQRITFLPHLVFGQVLTVFLLIAGGDLSILRRPGNWIFLGVMAFALGVVFPPGLIFLAVAYGFLIVIEAVADRELLHDPKNRWPWILSRVVSRAMIGIMALPSILYFQLMFGMYPWRRLVEFDLMHPLHFEYWEYVQALGMTFPLGMIGLVWALVRHDKVMKRSIAWVLAWIFCLGVFNFIPQQSPLRFTEMMPHIPLAILSIYVIEQVYGMIQKIGKTIGKRGEKKNALRDTLSTLLFVVAIIPSVTGLFFLYSMWLWQKDFLDQKIRAGWPFIAMDNYIVYPVKGVTDIFSYIETATDKDSVILTMLSAGNYIPAWTGRRVYVGHENTVRKEEKLVEAEYFFKGNMTVEQAMNFLHTHGITYVLNGPQEIASSGLPDITKAYPFLIEAVKNSDAALYRVP